MQYYSKVFSRQLGFSCGISSNYFKCECYPNVCNLQCIKIKRDYKITPHEIKDARLFFFLIFLQIYREVFHPLHQEEAECSSEAQDDHQQELPHQQEVTAVEERQRCKNRLTRGKQILLSFPVLSE